MVPQMSTFHPRDSSGLFPQAAVYRLHRAIMFYIAGMPHHVGVA